MRRVVPNDVVTDRFREHAREHRADESARRLAEPVLAESSQKLVKRAGRQIADTLVLVPASSSTAAGCNGPPRFAAAPGPGRGRGRRRGAAGSAWGPRGK